MKINNFNNQIFTIIEVGLYFTYFLHFELYIHIEISIRNHNKKIDCISLPTED